MATNVEVSQEDADKFLVEIDLDDEEREHCEWEGYIGTSAILTREQLINLCNRIHLLLGDTL